MEAMEHFPFNKLAVPAGEEVLWYGSNPTFHRASDYGIIITDQALYLYSPFWLWFARWKRYPLSKIAGVSFHNSRWRPKLIIQLGDEVVAFHTPHDFYEDEMEFDRRKLIEAARLIECRRSGT